ncbi:MAG: polymorphic toxin type 33 domain-containing protein, partial [Rhodococcus sp. (in: high G+C Gram-positive bacteria)]
KYTGHERDYLGGETVENTNYLDYMHARYYNPNLGRFLSVDPAYSDGTPNEPQKWNRYTYVTNNPLRFSDPDGRDKLDVVNGFFNSLVSNFGVTIRVDVNNSDYRRGQRAGDQAAVAIGGSLVAASPTISGGITIGTGGAGVVTVPIAAVAVTVGGMAVVNGGAHLMESNGSGGGEGDGEQDKELTKGEARALKKAGRDIHQIKAEALGTNKNLARWDLYKDKSGNILVKAKGGDGEAIQTGLNIRDFR